MKSRPILFKDEMVRAILESRKMQTRRIVKFPHENPLGMWEPMTIGGPKGGRLSNGATIPEQAAMGHTRTGDVITSPYGQPGDRFWVREAFRLCAEADETKPSDADEAYRVWYEADAPHQPGFGKLRPSMFMPRWASRITLEITGVRVERLQDISDEDALSEGVYPTKTGVYPGAPKAAFCELWESINGPDSWKENPWVWCITFRRLA